MSTAKQWQEILIVDDTPFNVEILQMMIKTSFGVTCEIAFSGEEALEKVKKRHKQRQFNYPMYKLIFMDINMPGITGVQTTQYIREYIE